MVHHFTSEYPPSAVGRNVFWRPAYAPLFAIMRRFARRGNRMQR
jgi:hypothetical protein